MAPGTTSTFRRWRSRSWKSSTSAVQSIGWPLFQPGKGGRSSSSSRWYNMSFFEPTEKVTRDGEGGVVDADAGADAGAGAGAGADADAGAGAAEIAIDILC
ncbi:hypothetical protein [Absidia glauca]|uniref:Uncharacterized protein n=1 Tax=Absidia glauca TaxID=4829 RepID=A0A163IYT2_ABSGL|nr:hypothetical protein [Absidia glauca]